MHCGCGSGAALARCPIELSLRLPDAAVRIEISQRLGLPLYRPGRSNLLFLGTAAAAWSTGVKGIMPIVARAPRALGRAFATTRSHWSSVVFCLVLDALLSWSNVTPL